ncbi:helix-turn-helix domain-containing protein [Algihabitans albus]|uniref:helix-turn-helix domain-containing protein n=1 Tax=Algihabitans albus TaxID=2164067 RepID=UPI0013C2A956|nr:AraC family transcriptional regulator [Algihabitans albus]
MFRSLHMQPSTKTPAFARSRQVAAEPGLQIVEIAPGATLSAFTGRNSNDEPEHAIFLGGAFFCLTFAGLRASRVGTREIEFPSRENAFALLSPKPVELTSIADAEVTRRNVALFLSAEVLDRLDIDLLETRSRPPTHVRHWRMTSAARGLALALLRSGTSAQVRRLRAEALALELLADVQEQEGHDLEASPDGLQASTLAALRRARDLMIATPSADHSLLSIATTAGISPTTLKRDFRKVFGISTIAFLRRVRLEQGRSLIEQEGLSVSSAAYACGYDHPGNFAQAFRKHFGFAPSQLRR